MNTIFTGDCLSVLPTLPANSVDSIITDPPYGLDFMGKSWDHGVPGVEFWQAALRVAKPGAILMAFGGTRTFHRLACAIEDAGWEDCEPERDADRIKDDGVGGDNPRNRSNNAKQNFHPTVKPVDLMRYLCKLTRTPTGGVVLDPFMGSGTTGIACVLEHRDFIGIEIDAKYAEIARRRIADMTGPLFVTA